MVLEGVRAVVLTHGSGGEFEPLLNELSEEGMAPDQIVLVHNPSVEGETAPMAASGIDVLSGSRNLGYAIGMNRGIGRLLERGCDFVLVVTHDARFRPGALRSLVAVARAHPEFGVLGPALILSGTGIAFSYGGVIRPNGTVEHIQDRPRGDGEIAPCDWIDGGTMLFDAGLLERLGGFDERFWLYSEDSEICLRARQAGARVGVLLDAEAEQAPGGANRPAAWSYLIARNGAALAYRAKGWRGLTLTLGRTVFEAALNLARAAARRLGLRPGPAVEPWAWAVGSARGTVDFLRRRWGPPPSLPGDSDIGNTGE